MTPPRTSASEAGRPIGPLGGPGAASPPVAPVTGVCQAGASGNAVFFPAIVTLALSVFAGLAAFLPAPREVHVAPIHHVTAGKPSDGVARAGSEHTTDEVEQPGSLMSMLWPDNPGALYTAGLFLVAVGQAILFFWQLGLISKGSADAKKAADAANAQATAFLRSQAPMIRTADYAIGGYPLLNKDKKPIIPVETFFLFNARSVGRSAAESTTTRLGSWVGKRMPEALPYGPPKEVRAGAVLIENEFEPIVQQFWLTDSERQRIKRASEHLWLYGDVGFVDLLDGARRQPFCVKAIVDTNLEGRCSGSFLNARPSPQTTKPMATEAMRPEDPDGRRNSEVRIERHLPPFVHRAKAG